MISTKLFSNAFFGLVAYSSMTICFAAPVVSVPFTLEGRVPTVSATVNGQPVRLFVDLGGFSSVSLSTDVIDKSDVNVADTVVQWRDFNGQVYNSRRFTASNVIVGGINLGTYDGAEYFGKTTSSKLHDGYIGFGLLSRYLVILDYRAGQMSLYRSGDSAAIAEHCGSNVFPIGAINGVVQSTVLTEKGDLIFQWDTGSTENVLRPSSLPSRPENAAIQSLAKFSIGSHNFGRIVLPLREFSAPSVDGVLGTDFFDRKIVCLDVAKNQAAVK